MSPDGDAHWALLGEAIVGFAMRRRRFAALPRGFGSLPGPAVVVAQRFTDSPVGPYLSLSVGEPARIGIHPGFYFGVSVLNHARAGHIGREQWGYPHQLGSLRWISEGTQRGIAWDERGIEVRAEPLGRALPLLVPVRTMQRRSDGPVIIPTRLRAMARRSRVSFIADADDPLMSINGFHRGLSLSGVLLRRDPARRPSGAFVLLRPPLVRPEPGVIGMEAPALHSVARALDWPDASSRAYSSVG